MERIIELINDEIERVSSYMRDREEKIKNLKETLSIYEKEMDNYLKQLEICEKARGILSAKS